MAFIIPSKNIYDKVSPIVKDNIVKKIEVISQDVSIVKEYDSIGYTYNEEIDVGKIVYSLPANMFNIDSQRAFQTQVRCAISYANYMPKYCSFGSEENPIKIPKSNNNIRIINIPFSQGNLDYSVYGDIKTYSITRTPTVSITNRRDANGTLQILGKDDLSIISDGSLWVGEDAETSKSNQQISLFDEYSSPTNEHIIWGDYIETTGEREILDTFRSRATSKIQNVSSVELVGEDDDYYYVTLNLLVGYIADYANYAGNIEIPFDNLTLQTYKTAIDMSGKRTETFPNRIEIRFKGEIVKLNVEDKNIIVGDTNSQSILSISKNEFIQGSTLKQSVTDNLNKVIGEYQNGKRTIELLCDINEYFRLPKEYQEVEYIESTGTQWIDTGVNGGNNANYDIVFTPFETVSVGEQIFSGQLTSTIPKIYRSQNWIGTPMLSLEYGNGVKYNYLNADNQKLNISVQSNGFVTINDSYTNTLQGYKGSGWGSKNWLIFNGNDERIPSTMRLYSLKMRNGTELIRDFIPCYRKSDGEIGLYDLVSSEFFINQGSEKFLMGELIHHKNKVFEEGEEIIPMVYTARGEDIPILKDQYSNPKKFKIVGTNVFFDGAVWQRIYGQEML